MNSGACAGRVLVRWVLGPTGLIVMVAALMVAMAPAAEATVLEALTVKELSERAATVVVAKTVGSTPRSVNAANGRGRSVETIARLHVQRVLKGAPGGEFDVSVPGGRSGDLTTVVEGMPVFSPGETCVLFLDEQNRVIGGTQGKLRVEGGKVVDLSRPLESVCVEVSATAEKKFGKGKSASAVELTLHTETATMALALDEDGMGTESVSATLEVQGSLTSIFSDGFESGTGNWTFVGSPTWATTDYRSASGSHSAYCVGSAISPPGPYVDDLDGIMYAGPFDLSSATEGSVDFDLWLDSELDYDGVQCLISTNESDFYGYGWSGDSGGWAPLSVDLTSVPDGLGGYRDVTGQSVWVMFRFTSDDSSSEDYEGAYVDNVVVSAGTTSGPTITSISPGEASAGTGSEVTITGTGFGSSQGSGHVDFFYKTGQPTIQAPIVSWSDTSIVAQVPVGIVNGYPGSAASGPVTVTDADGGTSEGHAFQVTFGYGGHRQSGTTCTYLLNANTADTTDEEALFDAGAATWNGVSAFEFIDGGTTSTSTWSTNGLFEVFWTSTLLPDGVVGAAMYSYDGEVLVEADIAFNDLYSWSSGTPGTFDVQSTAVHELGHWLNLRDLYGSPDSNKVMYGFGSTGAQKRSLDPDDAAGIAWIYGAPGLAVTGISPSSGSAFGGTEVTITGTGFGEATSVTFGGVLPDSFTVDSDTQIRTRAPAHAAGTVQVQVSTLDSSSADTPADDFTYVVPPTVTGLSPKTGLTSGGTSVTITGTGFTGATSVTFGGTAASFTVNSPTKISAKAPAHSAGVVNVRVSTPGGTSANTSADDFTYYVQPTVTRYEQNNSKLTYLGPWTKNVPSPYAASGWSYSYGNQPGCSLTLRFTGTTLDWITRITPWSGIAKVVLDAGTANEKITMVDTWYWTDKHKRKVYSTGTLAYGPHTLHIYWTGKKRANSWYHQVYTDAFDIKGKLTQAPTLKKIDDKNSKYCTYTPDWSHWDNSGYWAAYLDTYAFTDRKGDKLTVKFNGSYLSWVAATSNAKGKAKVILDGDTANAVIVDLYSPTTRWKQSVYDTGILADGNHTLVIECLRQKRPYSWWYTIDADRFDIL